MHAAYIARSIGIPRVIVPLNAGVGCAMGSLVMDFRYDVERTFLAPCDGLQASELNNLLGEVEAEAVRLLEAEKVDFMEIKLQRTGLLRYAGQSYEVDTPMPEGTLSQAQLAEIVEAFHVAHRREYGVANRDFPVAFVNIRVTATGVLRPLDLREKRKSVSGNPLKATRPVFFDGKFVDTPVYDALMLPSNSEWSGPAIIEHPETCLVTPPGATVRVDTWGNLIMDV